MTVRVLQLNQDGDPTGEPTKEFASVEKAQAWCEQHRGEKLEWLEEGRFFSLEGMTNAECDKLNEDGEYPPVRYWLHGVEEDGTDRELEDTDFEDWEASRKPVKTDYRSYIIVNRGTNEVYERVELAEVAFIVENDGTPKGKELISDLSWSIRRTGRWDRPDGLVIVIPSSPELVEA